MSRPKHEVAHIIKQFGNSFINKHNPNPYQLRVLGALSMCRTSAMGGHKYYCSHCKQQYISYNSCRNRHCPKCQVSRQAFWVEDRLENAFPVKHYHIVFTIPHQLNEIGLLDSRWFYNQLFDSVWDTLQSFGYSHFGVETGAICVLHTWGQNLDFHPHIHCIVPALGYTLKRNMKHIGKNGKYLYPVKQLSLKFRSILMHKIKKYLVKKSILDPYQKPLNKAWNKPWVVFCEPSLGKAEQVVGYLGQYIHRVAITNQRIVKITNQHVFFKLKDYNDNTKVKTIRLTGEEFLRRFCMHILPRGFPKIRYYGIYSSRFRSSVLKDASKMVIKPVETIVERIDRLTGIDVHKCPLCHKGTLVHISVVPRSRSPSLFYNAIKIR